MPKKKKKRKNLAARRFFIYLLSVLVIGVASYGLLSGISFVMKALRADPSASESQLPNDTDFPSIPNTPTSPNDGGTTSNVLSGVTICIDPGHGYSDGGTVSPDSISPGVMEKSVVLNIGLTLRDLLEQAGATVIMTREDDFKDDNANNDWKKLSLDDRCEIANNSSADFFISIHCDSFEDDSSIGGGGFYYFDEADRDESKLVDLIHRISQTVKEKTGDTPETVAQTGSKAFQVVRKVTVPATLYEIGFVTNPEDAANMANQDWRDKIAQGIFEGICNYFAS